MRTINLSTSETDKLNYERYHYPDPVIQKRLHADKVSVTGKWVTYLQKLIRKNKGAWLNRINILGRCMLFPKK